jgi:hypothetical protein
MPYHHTDASRADDALPNIETFYVRDAAERKTFNMAAYLWSDDYRVVEPGDEAEPGWYWWPCFPGCLPDGAPVGPFDTETEALADAREGMEGA